ncbi:MAG: DUF1638 domain-containing protein [Methanomassiliicoccaceae archaeon]|nr:DUF1638 domain-containing protein [Methanomassiliicoccaceae archaeon]
MVSGTLGIIGCPILEDELVYSLRNDPDPKNIILVDTPPAHTFKKKLELFKIPFKLVDEWNFNNGMVEIDDPNAYNIVIVMNKLCLHKDPKVLRLALEEQLMQQHSRFDVIAMYYGMCGNAQWDVSEWAAKLFETPVFVFRDDEEEVCDDCIGVAVGGHSRYCDFVRKHTGMFFVTPAIAQNWDDFINELGFTKGFEIMGINTTKEVFELFGYKKAVKIDTGIGIHGDELEEKYKQFSEETGLEFIPAKTDFINLYPTERLYKDAKNALNS